MARLNFKHVALMGGLAALSALWIGCSQNKPYRDDVREICTARSAADCPASAVQVRVDSLNDTAYTLGFVEYDDQGVVYDRAQQDSVLNYIKARARERHVLLVVFAHGWHHNARHGDENVDTFKTVLCELRNTEKALSKLNNLKPRKVMGIYVGWRGESIRPEGLNMLTFWDRKSTAHQVGSTGVPELLVRLERIKKIDREVADTSASFKNTLITVGHSFGGAVIYTALSQILVDRFSAETPKKFGDLVVLINPAFEANKFTVLHDMSRSRSYPANPNPSLVILTSESDDATKFWFRVGRTVSTLWEATTSDAEKKSIVHAVGHYAPYQTHRLVYAEQDTAIANADTLKRFRRTLAVLGSLREQLDSSSDTIRFPGSQLVFTPNGQEVNNAFNPLYVISVDGRIIADHNDLNERRTIDFLRSMIALTAASAPLNRNRSVALPDRFGRKHYFKSDSLGYHIRTDSVGKSIQPDSVKSFFKGSGRIRRSRSSDS